MGYPNYEEITLERERRKKQEMEGGRQRTLRAMAEGLVERLRDELIAGNRHRGYFKIDHSDDDPRKWVVRINYPVEGTPGIEFEENLWDFPSDELKTKLMLIQ